MGRGQTRKRRRSPAAPAPALARTSPAPLPRATVASRDRPRRDLRRFVYAGLDFLFAGVQICLILYVVPNRLPSASVHLWSLPIATALLGVGTLAGGRRGWWLAIVAGSAVLVSTFLLIGRIVVSAAFLAGVYGAFGKAAAMTALVSIMLVVDLVALLPIVQVKYLMTRAGRHAVGMR